MLPRARGSQATTYCTALLHGFEKFRFEGVQF